MRTVTPNKVGLQECPNCGAYTKESVEDVLFEYGSCDSQRQKFLGYMKQVLNPETFEAFNHSRILCWTSLQKHQVN